MRTTLSVFGNRLRAPWQRPTTPFDIEMPFRGNTVRGRILNNFFMTFIYAQGEGDLDTNLTNLVAEEYYTWPSFARKRAQSLGRLASKELARLYVPAAHMRITPRRTRSEFIERWTSLTQRMKDEPLSASQRASNISYAHERLIEADRVYMRRDRHITPDGDPHHSFYRTFVLQGAPTGSPEFNNVFTVLRREGAEALVNEPTVDFAHLQERWEQLHPGQAYLSDIKPFN